MPRSPSSDPAPLPNGDWNAPVYTFGPFRLDPSERRLVRGDPPVELTPKAFDTLVVLVERAGHLGSLSHLVRTHPPVGERADAR